MNRGESAAPVFVLVERAPSALAPAEGSTRVRESRFALSATLDEPPAGDVCATAPLLSVGRQVDQSIAGFTDDYSGIAEACLGAATPGPDRVYSFVVPAAKTLRVTVTPEDVNFDPAIYLIDATRADACTLLQRPCLGGVDAGGDGASETLLYVNGTGAPKPVWIVVDTFRGASAAGRFSLELALTP